jgi:molybdenum cofactor cytidylyltransferase
LEKLPVECVYNPDWEQGQSSSLRTGIKSLPLNVGAVIFLLVDQPFIPPELIQRLVKSHAVKRAPIIHPQVNDERANPVLFDREVFQELSSLEGDTGGRVLFNTFPTRGVLWENDLIRKDIDTPEDLEILRSAGE